MFASTRLGGSSGWDNVSLFSSPDLFGPWIAHPQDPVLIDVRASRPAGGMFERDGRLFRPAQDCSGGYGAALSLCEVDRLDRTGFAQTLRDVIQPAVLSSRGFHTLNWAAGIEVIDRLA